MRKRFDVFVQKALNKMFTYVGFDSFDKSFTDQYEDWYNQRTWTKAQSEEFKAWFVQEARKDLKFNKSMSEKEYNWFNLKWGWKELN